MGRLKACLQATNFLTFTPINLTWGPLAGLKHEGQAMNMEQESYEGGVIKLNKIIGVILANTC